MNCSDLTTHLDDLVDDALDAATAAAVNRHLDACDECRARAAAARGLKAALGRLPIAGPTPGFTERALARAARERRPRAPRIVAAGFVAAFAASIATVIYTGLLVEAPKIDVAAALPNVTMTVAEARTINLVFGSSNALDDVSLLIDLPEGIEITGYPGERHLRFSTQLDEGRNVLPIELVADRETMGQLVARLEHGDRQKVFRVHLSVGPG